jgi:hypothetical protein
MSKEKVESATAVAGGEKSEDDQLSPTALGIEDNGVNEGSSAKESFKKVDLRDLEAATGMILKALPDLKEYEVMKWT